MTSAYRQIPKVDRLLATPQVSTLPPALARAAVRQVLDALRAEIAEGKTASVDEVVDRVVQQARWLRDGRMRPVINATGVVLHTNLGRAPWSDAAIAAAAEVARGYCNLELDLDTGRRGGRLAGVSAQLAALVGAEAALVVNNCAAAVLLGLSAVAAGREVVVSRGELVEIGGSFRVPEVIASGGARLVEVGTTNRTRVADYAAGTTERTAAWLVVHPSNFRMVGFTEAPERSDLAAAARARGVALLEDQGSGALVGRPGAPGVAEALREGADLVFFSADKLLGGPQAGVIVGGASWVARLRHHPLYRALRVDKVILAALERTLGLHLAGEQTVVQRLLSDDAAVEARARRIAAALGLAAHPDEGQVGGGTHPGEGLPSWSVAIPVRDPDGLAARLRAGEPAVVGRVSKGAWIVDARTVRDDEVAPLLAALAAARATG